LESRGSSHANDLHSGQLEFPPEVTTGAELRYLWFRQTIAALALLIGISSAAQQVVTIKVDVSKPGAAFEPVWA